MKRILAIVLCAVMTLAFAIPAAALVNLSANNNSVAIDGVREEAYGESSTPIIGLRADTDPGAATGRVWSTWDSTYLYFYVEVDDKTPNHQQANEDNVEFMIDWNSGKGDSDFATPETPYWQVRCFANTPNLDGVNLNGLIMDAEGIDWSINYSEIFEGVCKWFSGPLNGDYKNGYVVEIAIAAPAGVTLSEGKTIPMEIQICDNITGTDLREGQVFFEVNDNNDSQWNTPSACNGLLTLGGAYVAPVVEAPAADAPAADTAAPAADTAPAEATTTTVAVRTGDSAIMFIILAAALVCAVVLTKRVSRNKA